MKIFKQEKTLNLFIFLGVFLIIFNESCHSHQNSLIENIHLDEAIITTSDSSRKSKYIQNVIGELKSLNQFECDYIGYGVTKSTQPSYDTILSKIIPEVELIKLTNNISPYVRISAFQALIIINSKETKKVFESHIKDEEKVNYFCGCILEEIPVNISLYNQITIKLNKSEREGLKKKILQQYKGTYYHFMIN